MSESPRKAAVKRPSKISMKELAARLESLELRFQDVEEFIKYKFGTWGGFPLPKPKPPETTKRGRKPFVPLEEHLGRRQWMIHFLESYWSGLQPLFAKRDAEQILARLTAIKQVERGALTDPIGRMLENFAELMEFLGSKDYRGDPRMLANAMAGLPELSLARSLRVLREHPSRQPLRLASVRDYIRRKYPARFRALCVTKSDEQRIAILMDFGADDSLCAVLHKDPDFFLNAWRMSPRSHGD